MNRDADIDRELRFHIEEQIDGYVRAGMSREEATRKTRLEFGGLQQIKEECRDALIVRWWDDLVRDVRIAIRGFRHSPLFFCVAVATLALGIGANTAIFSVVDGALLHPIPFPNPERLVAVYCTSRFGDKNAISYPNFLDWQRQNQSFESLAAWRTETFTLTGRDRPVHLVGVMVSASLFPTIQVQPLLGRVFRQEEDQPGAPRRAMIGESLWTQRFNRDPGIVGMSLTLDGRDYSVIGVVPSDVRLDRAGASFASDVFLPLGPYDNPLFLQRGARAGTVGLGRLKSGVSLVQAQADMNVIAARLESAYPESNRGVGVNVFALEDDIVGDARRILWMLLAAVGFVLLIACANVANLALVRSLGRTQEFAVCGALGASRGRLMRQLFTESLLVAIVGGILGIALARWTTKAALDLLPSTALPVMAQVNVNAQVLMFALAVSIVTAFLFGFAPARHASRSNLGEYLKIRSRGATERFRAQHLLVVGQIALTLVLLVGAGLMIRSVMNLLTGNFGFDQQGIVVVRTELPAERRSKPDDVRAAFAELELRLATIPGVRAASLEVGSAPFGGNTNVGFWPAEAPRPATPSEMRGALYSAVGPDYFRTMGIPVLRGRVFTHQDDARHPSIVIVDRELALTVFGTLDVIGRRIHNGFEQTLEIVGVVGHVTHRGLDSDATAPVRSEMYVPYAQLPDSATALFASQVQAFVRSGVPPQSLFALIRGAMSAFDPNVAIHDERTMSQAIATSQDRRRFSLVLLGLFAVIGLLLSAIGIYGVVSYGVNRRTSEIGIRLALGASRGNILTNVLGEGGRLAVSGTLLGVLASIGLTRFITSLLFGVSMIDPLTLGGTAALLLLVTLTATYIPARRATKIDPLVALRYE